MSAFIPEAPTLDRPRDDSDLVLFALLVFEKQWRKQELFKQFR